MLHIRSLGGNLQRRAGLVGQKQIGLEAPEVPLHREAVEMHRHIESFEHREESGEIGGSDVAVRQNLHAGLCRPQRLPHSATFAKRETYIGKMQLRPRQSQRERFDTDLIAPHMRTRRQRLQPEPRAEVTGHALYIGREIVVAQTRQTYVGPQIAQRHMGRIKHPRGMRGRIHIVAHSA